MLKLLRITSGSTSDSILFSSSTQSTKALDLFDYLQIYPGSKIRHFEKLHQQTGIAYEDMVFFDDESRNREVERLGVVMWLVRDGVSSKEIDEGVRSWRKRNKRTET
jgi:magnesium-dependent phosphatase 1